MSNDVVEKSVEAFVADLRRLTDEVSRLIVGHRDIVDGVTTCLLAGGHALLEGVQGLGKTMLVRTLARALNITFSRIQFTPDLMPADVVGTNMITEDEAGHRAFSFQRGPVFTHILLADEINRATPKTQSAMLEAMQEKRVTVGGTHLELEPPFFVMATQNPLEMEGTYPLPEAQLDRFFFKILLGLPDRKELNTILTRTTGKDEADLGVIMKHETVLDWIKLAREVVIAEHVQDYAVRLTLATHPEGEFASDPVKQYVRYGSSPRGAQALILSAKIRALLDGRFNVSYTDVEAGVLPALRHRLILNFEAEADAVTADSILGGFREHVPRQMAEAVGV